MTRRVPIAPMVLLGAMVMTNLMGCTGARIWQYPPEPPGAFLNVKGTHTVPMSVAVIPLRDLRGQDQSRGSWVVAIPLIPYGVNSFDRPETVQDPPGTPLIHMNPSRDFAHAIASELQHSGIFSSVMFAENPAAAKADLILSGTLRSTNWRRSFTTYGLGPGGPLLWILGAPMGKATNTVAMDLQLSPAGEPSRVLWQFSMEFEDSHLIGIYYGLDRSVENYADAVQETLKPALRNLVHIATQHPEILRPAPLTGLHAAGVKPNS